MTIELGDEIPEATMRTLPAEYRAYAERLAGLSLPLLAVEHVRSHQSRPKWLDDLGMAVLSTLAAAIEASVNSGQAVDLVWTANALGQTIHDAQGCGTPSELAFNLLHDILDLATMPSDADRTYPEAAKRLSRAINDNALVVEFMHWSLMTRLLNREAASRNVKFTAVRLPTEVVTGVDPLKAALGMGGVFDA